MLHVTFPEIVSVMQGAGSTVSVAEGHGCLCGALCISDDCTLERWLEELIPEEEGVPVADDIKQTMYLLYADTLRALRGDEMDFQPFLPDDAVALEQRTTALSQWCQGFLYGLGTARPLQPERMPKSIDEVLLDFTSISRAEADPSGDAEEDEEAYTEVVEYIRAATQLIHDELDAVRSDSDVPSDDDGLDDGPDDDLDDEFESRQH
ncbi:UPF0149 family protein [Povalibacter sp.]|uniref:UPF0149 family protein n=1 Tax=Povalibacter sp. TaxID=1962978 RepID=UPI002F427043